MVRGMGSLGSNYNALITVLQKKVQEVCMAKDNVRLSAVAYTKHSKL